MLMKLLIKASSVGRHQMDVSVSLNLNRQRRPRHHPEICRPPKPRSNSLLMLAIGVTALNSGLPPLRF